MAAESPTATVCSPTGRLWAMRMVWSRNLGALLLSPGTLFIFWLAGMAAFLFLVNIVESVRDSGLGVQAAAFSLPVYAFILIASMYLALSLMISAAREVERGTWEILFFGPVDSLSYVMGKAAAGLTAFLAALALGLTGYAVLAVRSGLYLPTASWILVALSIPTALYVTAIGICLAALTFSLRGALTWFLALAVLLLAVQFGIPLLALAPSTSDYYDPVRVLRQVLSGLNQTLAWISPFGLLSKGAEAIRRGDAAAAGTVACLTMACAALCLTIGVRRLGPRA